ncbi:uncharacterized protein LOC135154231 [Lytechinus pictus]|uniref:uncharacterized protein LOC135154231 n=1 Tax=Lytechinus pictus TaxID=7653 RepID=UPI0030BA14B4
MVFLSLMAYGVRGSLLILGGLLMNLLPIGYALKVSTKQEEITDDDSNDESLPLISRPKETVENINASGSNGNATNALGEIRAPKVDSSKKSPDKEGYFLNSSQRHTPSDHLERKNSDRLREAENQPSQVCCDDTDETRKETKDKNGRIWKMLSRLKEVMHMDFFNEHPLLSCTLIPSVGIFNCVILGWDLFEVTYGISRGIDRRTVKFIPIASFAGCAFSHILLIFIFQRKPQYNILVFFSSCCLATLGFFLMNLSSLLWYILMVSFVMGVGTNGVINTSEGVIAFVVENRSFAHGSSLIDLFTGLGLITAGLVAGYIKDVSGSMVTLYWSLGGMNLVASLLTLVMVCKVSRALACCQQ